MGSIMYQGASPKIMYQGVEYGGVEIHVKESIIKSAGDWDVAHETSMNITWDNSEHIINFIYPGGSYIGASIVSKFKIPASAKKVHYEINTRNAYSTAIERFRLGIGVSRTTQSGVILNGYNKSDWVVFKDYTATNSFINANIDLENYDEELYLYILGSGWNADITTLEIWS